MGNMMGSGDGMMMSGGMAFWHLAFAIVVFADLVLLGLFLLKKMKK